MSDNFELKTEDLEFYETPIWAVKRILEAPVLPVGTDQAGPWIDPCAGSCAIQDAVLDYGLKPRWTLLDIDSRHLPAMRAQEPQILGVCDFLRWDTAGDRYKAAILNPPFSRAVEFVRKLRPFCEWVVMLQRLDWLGGARERTGYLRQDVPDTWILPDRPSFTGGQTDLREYAWFVWHGSPRMRGVTGYLDYTSPAEKKALRGQMTLGV